MEKRYEPVSSLDCDHITKRLCGMDSRDEHYHVSVCRRCGEILISGDKDGVYYGFSFSVNTLDTLNAMAQSLRALEMNLPGLNILRPIECELCWDTGFAGGITSNGRCECVKHKARKFHRNK